MLTTDSKQDKLPLHFFPTSEATLAPGEPYHCKKPSAGACSPGCPSGCSPPRKVPPAVARSATWRDPELLQSAEASCLWHPYTKWRLLSLTASEHILHAQS